MFLSSLVLVVVVVVLPKKVIPCSQGVSVKRVPRAYLRMEKCRRIERNADSKKTISKKEKTRNADGK